MLNLVLLFDKKILPLNNVMSQMLHKKNKLVQNPFGYVVE